MEEPTPRAGPCIGDVIEWLSEFDRELWSAAVLHEYNYYEVVFRRPEADSIEVVFLLYVGEECMEIRGVAVRGCGSASEPVARLGEKPEFVVVDVEGDCITVRAPAEPSYRVIRALDLAGFSRDYQPADLRPLEDLVEAEEEWFSTRYASA